MKKLLFLLPVLFCFLISAQEIDEEYLSSLPEDVREDVLERVKLKKETEKPVYRKASTEIDKIDLEDYYDDKDDKEEKKPGIFGEAFFDTIQSSFMPINEPNLDGFYVLDFGDVLEIQLIGQVDSVEEYPIKRDGSINLPNVGKISLSGLSLSDASALIKAKIKNAYIGTEAFITLINIRDIRVLISGNAFNPGIYTLNGNSNILHALTMAGGVNDIGSYRNIDLIRNNEIIDTLDVYEILIYGTNKFNTTLRSGDTIFVNSIGKVVSIESGVLRPGKYEMKPEESFKDLIFFGNGIIYNADKSNLVIKRVDSGKSLNININLDSVSEYAPKNGDSLFIREYKFNEIKISGAVKNPGIYLVPIGTKLSKVIEDSGGYEDSAYPFGGYLENKRSLLINEDARDKLYDKFINNIITNSSTQPDAESLGLVLKQIKDAEVTGRIIAEFDLDVLNANPMLDTILENEDEIMIPYITQQVYIQGEVNNPGAVRYFSDQDISFYIKAAGGSLNAADLDTIFIIHPNGETKNLDLKNSRLTFLQAEEGENLIYPGSIIYVPRDTNFANNLEIASIWAPIISSVALSLTSLSVLNSN